MGQSVRTLHHRHGKGSVMLLPLTVDETSSPAACLMLPSFSNMMRLTPVHGREAEPAGQGMIWVVVG